MQVVFELFFFFFFFFFYYFILFENIVDSPLNQSRNTREKRELPTLQSTYSTAQVKEQKTTKTLYSEYRRFADFPQTLGIKPGKRNIRRTTLASPRKVCVMQSCAKLLGIVMLYPETILLAKLCEIPRSNLTKYPSLFFYLFNK